MNKFSREQYKIVITGQGYVGLVLGACLAEKGYKILGLDNDQGKINQLSKGMCSIYEPGLQEIIQKNINNGNLFFSTDCQNAYQDAEYIFICVGTPEMDNGCANLNYVVACALQIAEYVTRDCTIIIKSTVPIGTNSQIESYIRENLKHDVNINVVSNPEFLSQGSAVSDMMNGRIVIGTDDEEAKQKVSSLYEPFKCPVVFASRESAELIKYASNNFLSLKISYINEIATLCELTGCDIHDIVAGMSLDERIGDQFLRAGIGYGGSCFEKDAKALCHIAQENGYHLKTVEAGLKVNNEQKTHMLMKAIQCVNLNNLKVAVLGLTFKPETDDVRNAPSLDNVKRLLDLGSHIVAYDPVGVSSFMKHFPEGEYGKGSIRYKQSAEEALTDADICFIFTEWQEFKELDPSIFIKRMKCPRVFDGRNIYMKKKMIDLGIKYYSVGN